VSKAAHKDQDGHMPKSIRNDLWGEQEEGTYQTEETQQSEKEFEHKNQKKKIQEQVQ